jgi:hypothetical protein
MAGSCRTRATADVTGIENDEGDQAKSYGRSDRHCNRITARQGEKGRDSQDIPRFALDGAIQFRWREVCRTLSRRARWRCERDWGPGAEPPGKNQDKNDRAEQEASPDFPDDRKTRTIVAASEFANGEDQRQTGKKREYKTNQAVKERRQSLRQNSINDD